MFEVGIGTSQNWDPVQAGSEVIQQALKPLSKPPKFVLLFSTIHYEKDKGFQKILDTIYHFIPKDTALVGGTVDGFINTSGCYTRGLTALACYSDEIDVGIGIGSGTKRNPTNAAKRASNMIKENLQKSKYQNTLVLNLMSGTTIPSFPLIGQKRIISAPFPFISDLFIQLMIFSTKVLQIGMGREPELLDALTTNLEDAYIIGGSCTDDNKIEKNYEFFANKVLTNVILLLAIKTNKSIDVASGFGLKESGKQFRLDKKTAFGCMIKTINNKPAKNEFLRLIGWPEEYLNEKTIFKKSFQYPFCFYDEQGTLNVKTFGLFFGDYVGVASDLRSKDLFISTGSGLSLVNSVDECWHNLQQPTNLDFVFGVECGIHFEALGRHINTVRNKLNKYLKDGAPYLIINTAGENIYHPVKKIKRHVNLSFNLAVIKSDV